MPTLTAPVTGAASSGTVLSLVASTTYSVTVSNNDAGGAGTASDPLLFTTDPATEPPSAPTITHSWWAGSSLALTWMPPSPGNSAIDVNEVTAVGVGEEKPTPYVTTVSGSATSAYLSVDHTTGWSVSVRAHNAAGWGPPSQAVFVPALDD